MGLPVEVNNLMLGSLGGYTVGRSLRFRSSASAYLNRTQTAGSQTTWTWSGWVKRGKLTTSQYLMQAGGSSGSGVTMSVIADDFQIETGNGTTQYYARTTAQYRDPSAWYHVVMVCNTTSATSTLTGTPSDRLQIWINGVQVTSFSASSIPTQNFAGYMNQNTVAANIGRWNGASPSYYYDGYLAEVNFIDGQALTPSSFGAYDTNGVWQPKKYSGTYGTNGFYLPFSNTTSTTTLVQDSSGNGNNWTPNNISLTAGTTYDSMIDSPTNSASSSNYAVLNPLQQSSGITLSNANLTAYSNAQGNCVRGTIAISSGKWYWEAVQTAQGSGATNNCINGIMLFNEANNQIGLSSTSYGYVDNGNKVNNNTQTAYGATYGLNDVMGIALDLDGGTITFYKNNVSQGTAFTGLSGTFMPAIGDRGGGASKEPTWAINFGQRPFTYTPPSGYKALNTYNLPVAPISNGAQYMAATTYTGNGSTQSISNAVNGVSFQPDFVWIKNRAAAVNHQLQNSNAGWQYGLNSNTTSAEFTDANAITGSTSSGWSMNNNYNSHNQSGVSYVGWNWKAGGTGVTNTSGTITSTVSANTTAGFSVVTWTGNGTNGATVGHGLGVTPAMVFVKNRSAAGSWIGWHTSISQAIQTSSTIQLTGYTGAIFLNLTNASQTYAFDSQINGNTNNMVAYCFAAVRGYSAFGSYNGTGSSDGAFVYTGFRPRWIMVKSSTTVHGWEIYDTSRDPYNVAIAEIDANSSAAEYTAKGASLDFLSNGFKIRYGSSGFLNASGQTYIYMAIAESPFQISRAR